MAELVLPPPSSFLAPIVPASELIEQHPALHEPVIFGLLRRGETMNMVAAPKAGKSWLAHSLALAVANGAPWLGFETTPRCVLYVDLELHRSTFAYRLRKVAEKSDLSTGNIFACCERGAISGIDGLEQRVDELKQFGLIIVDAWYRALPPDCDENCNGDVMGVYNRLDAIAAETGCAFVLIHHTTKGSQGLKSTTDVGAGAGSQSRAADTHLVIRELKTPDAFGVSAVVRSWPRVEPFAIRRDFPLFVRDDSIDPTSFAGTKSSSSSGGTPSTSVKPTKQELVRHVPTVALGGDPKTRAEVVELLRQRLLCSASAAETAVKSAVELGLVRLDRLPNQPPERRASKFVLPPLAADQFAA